MSAFLRTRFVMGLVLASLVLVPLNNFAFAQFSGGVGQVRMEIPQVPIVVVQRMPWDLGGQLEDELNKTSGGRELQGGGVEKSPPVERGSWWWCFRNPGKCTKAEEEAAKREQAEKNFNDQQESKRRAQEEKEQEYAEQQARIKDEAHKAKAQAAAEQAKKDAADAQRNADIVNASSSATQAERKAANAAAAKAQRAADAAARAAVRGNAPGAESAAAEAAHAASDARGNASNARARDDRAYETERNKQLKEEDQQREDEIIKKAEEATAKASQRQLKNALERAGGKMSHWWEDPDHGAGWVQEEVGPDGIVRIRGIVKDENGNTATFDGVEAAANTTPSTIKGTLNARGPGEMNGALHGGTIGQVDFLVATKDGKPFTAEQKAMIKKMLEQKMAKLDPLPTTPTTPVTRLSDPTTNFPTITSTEKRVVYSKDGKVATAELAQRIAQRIEELQKIMPQPPTPRDMTKDVPADEENDEINKNLQEGGQQRFTFTTVSVLANLIKRTTTTNEKGVAITEEQVLAGVPLKLFLGDRSSSTSYATTTGTTKGYKVSMMLPLSYLLQYGSTNVEVSGTATVKNEKGKNQEVTQQQKVTLPEFPKSLETLASAYSYRNKDGKYETTFAIPYLKDANLASVAVGKKRADCDTTIPGLAMCTVASAAALSDTLSFDVSFQMANGTMRMKDQRSVNKTTSDEAALNFFTILTGPNGTYDPNKCRELQQRYDAKVASMNSLGDAPNNQAKWELTDKERTDLYDQMVVAKCPLPPPIIEGGTTTTGNSDTTAVQDPCIDLHAQLKKLQAELAKMEATPENGKTALLEGLVAAVKDQIMSIRLTLLNNNCPDEDSQVSGSTSQGVMRESVGVSGPVVEVAATVTTSGGGSSGNAGSGASSAASSATVSIAMINQVTGEPVNLTTDVGGILELTSNQARQIKNGTFKPQIIGNEEQENVTVQVRVKDAGAGATIKYVLVMDTKTGKVTLELSKEQLSLWARLAGLGNDVVSAVDTYIVEPLTESLQDAWGYLFGKEMQWQQDQRRRLQ